MNDTVPILFYLNVGADLIKLGYTVMEEWDLNYPVILFTNQVLRNLGQKADYYDYSEQISEI